MYSTPSFLCPFAPRIRYLCRRIKTLPNFSRLPVIYKKKKIIAKISNNHNDLIWKKWNECAHSRLSRDYDSFGPKEEFIIRELDENHGKMHLNALVLPDNSNATPYFFFPEILPRFQARREKVPDGFKTNRSKRFERMAKESWRILLDFQAGINSVKNRRRGNNFFGRKRGGRKRGEKSRSFGNGVSRYF